MSLAMRPDRDAPASLRKRWSRRLRYLLRLAVVNWPPFRFARLAGSKAGRDCVILGNGPSLAAYDLSRLAAYDICVVNMGVRALDQGLPHATIHVVVDKNRYLRFADEMERYAREHMIPVRIFGVWFRSRWRAREERAAAPYFVVHHHEHVSRWGFRKTPHAGYGSCSTVVCIALQMLYFMGYANVYVLGVDLDYAGDKPYFYDLGAKDSMHEDDLKVQARRRTMHNANAEFAIMRAAFEASGRGLYNAGAGGGLKALERRQLECFAKT